MSLAPPASGRRARRITASLALLVALVAAPVVASATTGPATAASAASGLTLPTTEFQRGDTLSVEYATDDPHATNWIGIYRAGQIPASGTPSLRWSYAPEAAGTWQRALDLAPGAYQLYFLSRDGYTVLSGPTDFTIAATSTIALSGTEFEAGQTIRVDYATDDPHATNWIGIYREGDTPGPIPSQRWGYTGGASGTWQQVLDLTPGSYEVYFLSRGEWGILAGPQPFTIAAPVNQPVPGNPNAPVEIDPVASDIATDGVILREGFDAGIPEGWTAEGGWAATTRAAWKVPADQMRDRFARTHAGFVAADAGQAGTALDATLTSAPVPVAGLASVRFTFDSHYRGVESQSGVVTVSFDGKPGVEVLRLDSTTVANGYDETQMNASQDVTVEVPAGAKNAVVTWAYEASAGALRYWAIDSFTAHQVAVTAEGGSTNAWVVSDIQGHPGDFAHGLRDFAELSPNPAGLLMVGDIVGSGTVREWQEIYDVMDGSTDIRPEVTVAAIGNHERYAAGGFEANRDRFLAFAERDEVWDEYVLEGDGGDLPVIVLGQEFASPSDVAMSDAQVEFLEDRLAHWTALDSQVLVITHFPLGNTVSATWAPNYSRHHQHNDRLTSILGNYPNAIVFTGHTHYPAEQGDWAMQRRTADGTADGFWAVNTLAMHVEWDARGENTAGRTEVTTGDINRGLIVKSYGDRVVVTAHDFFADTQLREVTIRNPLVSFTPELAVDVAPVITSNLTDGAFVRGTQDVVMTVTDEDPQAFHAQLYTAAGTQVPTIKGYQWMPKTGELRIPGAKFGDLADGRYYLLLSAKSQSGLSSSLKVNLVVDTTRPELTASVVDGRVVLEASDASPLRRVAANLYNASNSTMIAAIGSTSASTAIGEASWDGSWAVPAGLAPGTYTVRASVTDVAGNTRTVTTSLVIPAA